MAKWITKKNVTRANIVLSVVFLITLVGVAIPLIKKEPSVSLFPERPRVSSKVREPTAKEEEIYACPRHPDVKSSSPGECPQCKSELEKVEKFAAIASRSLFFDPTLRPPKIPDIPPPPPLQFELAGVSKIGPDYVAIIRDKAKRDARGFSEYMVREGEEVPGYFGVVIVSITPDPPSVKYDRAGVGMEELKMEEVGLRPAGTQQEQWAGIIMPVRAGYTYVVKLAELQRSIPSIEAYRGTFELEPEMEGNRAKGLKITKLTRDNLLYAAGLQQGDVIESIYGSAPPGAKGGIEPVAVTDEASAVQFLRSLASSGPGSQVMQVTVLRGRTRRTIMYTLLKKAGEGGE